MLRALPVFVAASLGSAAFAGQEPFACDPAGVPPAVSGDPVSASEGGLIRASWFDAACADPWTPSAQPCDDCAGLCGADPPIRLRFGLPAWLPEVHGTAAVRGVQAPVNVTTRDLFKAVDDIDFAIVGRVEADAGRWGLIADGLYLNLSGTRGFAGDRINVAAGFEQAIVDAAVTYDVQEQLFGEGVPDGFTADALAGARYWLVGSDGVTVTGPRGNGVTRSGTEQWVDPIFGGRIAVPVADDLLFRLRADVGGFGVASDLTWNVEAVGEYRCSDCLGLQLGYRVLDVDYSNGGFAYDVNYRGPIATLVLDF